MAWSCRISWALDTLNDWNHSTMDDVHQWRFESSGIFSTKSAYRNYFLGYVSFEPWKRLWKSWAPSKCKTFVWLAIRNCCWTADRLQKKGSPSSRMIPLCDQAEEHIFTSCVFAPSATKLRSIFLLHVCLHGSSGSMFYSLWL